MTRRGGVIGKSMCEQRDELIIQRILIGLDTSHHSLAALQAAAELAASLEAELHGLFIEDVTLLRVAKLPVTEELRFPFATRGRLNPRRMIRQLHAQAQQAEQALSSLCKRHQVEWSFRVVRGQVSAQILKEAAEADLLCVGRASRPVMHRSSIGSTAEAAALGAPCCVLLVSRKTRIHPPIVVLFNGEADDKRALLLAARVALSYGGLLSVLVPPSARGTPKEIREEIKESLDMEGLMIRYRELSGSGVMSLTNAAQTEGVGMLVMERRALAPTGLTKLLNTLDCPVLLVG